MGNKMSYKGDVLIVIGVLIIVITFILGYGLYNSTKQMQLLQSSVAISGNNITNSFNQLATNISTSLNGPFYIIIDIIILFLFASIGYKIADLGIRINSIIEITPNSKKKE
ncbi:MAG: hypothetical protein QXD23_02090 [Candidatus Micrarchaeaceae archaeon]